MTPDELLAIEAPDLTEALDALEAMAEQYLSDRDCWAGGYEHYFMSAGEEACDVLARLRPWKWALTPTGVQLLLKEQ